MNKLYTELNKDVKNFYCYSINLYRFLKNNGLRYESKMVVANNKTCWVFKRTPVFEILYQQFAENKKAFFEAQGEKNE
jgi:hypothetical protein